MNSWNWKAIEREINEMITKGESFPSISEFARQRGMNPETMRIGLKRLGFHHIFVGKNLPKIETRGIPSDTMLETHKVIKNEDESIEAINNNSTVPRTAEELAKLVGISLDEYVVIKFESFAREVQVKDEQKDLFFDEGKITGTITKSGKMNVETLWSCRAVFRPKEVEDQTILLKAITLVLPVEKRREDEAKKSEYKHALLIPDIHFGFHDNGRTIHDTFAIDAMMDYIYDMDFDYIIQLGDLFDFEAFSRFNHPISAVSLVQKALEYGATFLGRLSARYPRADKRVIEGNHDKRIRDYLMRLAPNFASIKRIDRETGARTDIASLADIIGMKEIGWNFIPGYPNNGMFIGNHLYIEHGTTVGAKSGQSVMKRFDTLDSDYSVVFAHTHRIEYAVKRVVNSTVYNKTVANIGCLVDVHGNAPGSRFDSNWQQGFAIVKIPEFGEATIDIRRIVAGSVI